MATQAIGELETAVQIDGGKWKVSFEVAGKPQTFIYDDEADLSRQLIKAQKNASQKIADQEKRIRELAPLEARQKWQDHCIAEGKKFRSQNPDLALYDPSDQMKIEQLIYAQMEETFPDVFKKAQTENFTAENLGKAYMELGESESLPARPAAVPQQQPKETVGELPTKAAAEENTPARPARTFSTGVRNGVGTHAAPTKQTRKPAEEWAKIDAMSSEAYDRKIATDPEFRKLVDSLPARA